MQTQPLHLWWLRTATFLLAALAAASAAYWVLKWIGAAPAGATAAPIYAAPAQTDPQVVARVLGGGQPGATGAPGAGAVPASAASRFKLSGVVADRAQGGYALISVDGKAAKPYRVGAPVDDSLVLHSVAARSAALAPSRDAPVAFTLELPKLAQP